MASLRSIAAGQQTAPALTGIRDRMRSVRQRQAWLWLSGMAVTVLLTICVATFAFPGLLGEHDTLYAFNLDLAVRGLVGLILLFVIYTVYQQVQIHRIQSQLNDQIGAWERLHRVEERTEEAYKIAALDVLTGLYNRRSGELRLTEEIARSARHDRPLTILMLDLNGLKQTNDTLGHPAGDHLLRFFAERIQRAVRGSDVAIRLGGDEFLVLLPECKLSEVQLVLNRLHGLTVEFEGQEIPLSFAAGWTDYVKGESPETLMMRADKALYTNKRAIKDQSSSMGAGKTGEIISMPPLTARELEVFRFLAKGNSNKEIAAALNISVRTVETHRANVMEQLGVHSISELILYAVNHKIQ